MTTAGAGLRPARGPKNPGVPKPDDWKPYVPPAPKEKKEKPPPKKASRKKRERFADADYSRPRYVTSRRQRRRRGADSEEDEGL